MIDINKLDGNVFIISITTPRKSDDENILLDFLNEVLEFKSFGLILNVEGNRSFTAEGKKSLGIWFKLNKKQLGEKCRGFARVSSSVTKLDKLKSKALRLAMPCPYIVLRNTIEATAWLNKNTDIL